MLYELLRLVVRGNAYCTNVPCLLFTLPGAYTVHVDVTSFVIFMCGNSKP